jgi:antitoxin component YwqK of YwqJK toxin-antitoxin module
MNYNIAIAFLLSVLLLSCAKNEKTKNFNSSESNNVLIDIPNVTVDESLLDYSNKISVWTLNNQRYTGYAVSFYNDSTLKEKIVLYKGKKVNQAKQWYADGSLKQIANYHEGKLHGVKKIWSPDTAHILLSHLNYSSGKPDGEQKIWYPSGELHKKLNLVMGREEGLQQAFRQNGATYANYEAREGRIFGLRKAKLCYGLSQEEIEYETE